MAKPRLLVIYRSDGPWVFGDRIRTENILTMLRINKFEVVEKPLSSFTRWNFWKALPFMFPFNKEVMTIRSRRDFLKWLDFNSLTNNLKRTIRKTNPDIILVETSIIGWIAKKICDEFKIPWIVDCHGLAFAEARGKGYDNWNQIERLERETFKKCDYIVVVSKKMKDHIQHRFGISSNKIIIASNGSHPQQFTAQYKFPLRAIYAGIFEYWEKVHDFLDVAKQANKEFKFFMAGNGPLRQQLLKKIKGEKIPVTYLGYIPRNRVPSLFAQMHIGIAPSTKDLAREVASPIKVFDYMASGLPVITLKIGDWGDMIKQEDCGIALEDDTIENYVEALTALAQENIWRTKSENAIRAVKEKYNWSKTLQPIIDLLLTFKK